MLSLAAARLAGEISIMAMFTSLHGQHSVAWTIPGFTLPTVCIACMMERLENKRELTTRISKILTELKTLLGEGRGKSKLMEVLESDKRVLERMCGHLFGEYRAVSLLYRSICT